MKTIYIVEQLFGRADWEQEWSAWYNGNLNVLLGVPGFRSVMDVTFRKWLLTKGINPSELNIVEASFPQMRDLLKGGQLDAVAVVEPFKSRIIGDQTGNNVADYLADLGPDLLGPM